MRQSLSYMTICLCLGGFAAFEARAENLEPASAPLAQQIQTTAFKPFTGKILKNKVRLRLQPNLDAPILKELSKDEMVIVVGETEDFYAVQPPSDLKAYIFRTFVLDNVVEGNRVNIRLEPDLEAPVIAQLNSGDRVDGIVSPFNNKWLEMAPPASTRFYISKEYIDKIGDAGLMATIEKRREEVNFLLNSTYAISQSELQKPFNEINLDGVIENFNNVISKYGDFPDQSAKAKELLGIIQESYLRKKIAYLEARAQGNEAWNQNKSSKLTPEMESQQNRLSQLQEQMQKLPSASYDKTLSNSQPPIMTAKMGAWLPIEKAFYESWAEEHAEASQEDFYQEELNDAVVLKGLLEMYNRPVKNKPGDYILINQATNLPTAYLYSTKINLQDWVGHEIKIKGTPRPNNNFAFPAYFVLELE